jgi:hypothetical protein
VPYDRPEGLSSHAARHVFTHYFETHTRASPPQIDYLRGDTPGDPSNPRAADAYVNSGYEDIEDVYDEVYRLGVI